MVSYDGRQQFADLMTLTIHAIHEIFQQHNPYPPHLNLLKISNSRALSKTDIRGGKQNAKCFVVKEDENITKTMTDPFFYCKNFRRNLYM